MKILNKVFLGICLCFAILLSSRTVMAGHKNDREIYVSTVEELNTAVLNQDPKIIVEPGTYQLTEKLVLSNIALRGSKHGKVIFDVSQVPVEDIPLTDCEGGIVGTGLFTKAALIVGGYTVIENIHFAGLNYPLEAYIQSTNEPCANGQRGLEITIRRCTFTADPDLFTAYDVGLGNVSACGSCNAHSKFTLEENIFEGSIFGAFILNEESDKGSVVSALVKNNVISGMVTGFVVGNLAGPGGIVKGESIGNTFKNSLLGFSFVGGSNPFPVGIGSSNCTLVWKSSHDTYKNNNIGFSVMGARFHDDYDITVPPNTGPSTGNLVQVSFFKPVFQGNTMRDGEFYASSTEERGARSLDIRDPYNYNVGWVANQIDEDVFGKGNKIELLAFKNPVFKDHVGRIIFRHHNDNYCIWEQTPFGSGDPEITQACADLADLVHPPYVGDFGNNVRIYGTRKDFLKEHPEFEEMPTTEFFAGKKDKH